MTIHDLARPATQDRSAAQALRGLCDGAVHLPGDPGFDAARMAWNLAVDQHPAAVAHPADARQTAQVVRAAAAAGLRVAPQTTGHNAGPLGRLDDVVIVRTAAMSSVQVDPARHTARVGGGTVWLPAVAAAAQHGFATLHGSAPDVGIAGYSLGGGIGWYARALGLQANSVTGVEVVTPDGDLVRADAGRTPNCSGRCAAAAATSVSSPPWNSGSSRSPPRSAACWSGMPPRPSRCCGDGFSGPATRRTR